MNRLLSGQVENAKRDIKTRYVAGESVPLIAKSYKVSDRDIYYHLGVLSPDEKALHAKNAALRSMAVKQTSRKEEHVKANTKSETKTADSSLSDFVG